MIDIKADAKTRERYVQNILDVWQAADSGQEMRGRQWYRTAHEVADMMTEGDVRTGAGLLAALSPQTAWPLNVELAKSAYETGRPSGHLGDALAKAAKILAGADPTEVLPMDRKTGHFYRCILDPSDADAVCIDRHAHDIAVGEEYGARDRGLGAKGRYALIAHCFREAAQRLGELPMVVQSVTWVVWRDRLVGTSTRGTEFNKQV
ncbi:hypothetical protein SEA_ISSMI_74 [Streptomyces phage Issmi]|uniref:Uncharacterized protein n=1 Tax=Streptomyces phage Issmi TaxID=2725628 RepID=A0A6M3SZT8_9CAUD|nr:hypothetical protein KGG87_gp74 [Streptomyces phage Issmi]QJD50720.1 hypothetical protein SEA_ISSMI_74 [Streptomyces phage Issmi]